MGLESVTYISDLVATNPVGATDPKSQGDDHIRNIKLALLNTFPNITDEVVATHAQINALAGGTLAAANGSNLTNLNASNIASGTLADGRLSSNVPLKDAANTFTKSGAGLGSSAIAIAANTPNFLMHETDQGEDGGLWVFSLASGQFRLGAVPDNYSGSISNSSMILNVTRSGADIASTTIRGGAEIELNATLLDFNGNADISGTLAVGGAVTLSGAAGARVFDIVNTDASQIWAMRALTNQLQIGARASNGSWSNPPALVATRSGDTITQVEIPVALIAGSARIASEGGVIYHDSTNNLGGKIVLSSSAATTAGQVGAAGDMRFVYS